MLGGKKDSFAGRGTRAEKHTNRKRRHRKPKSHQVLLWRVSCNPLIRAFWSLKSMHSQVHGLLSQGTSPGSIKRAEFHGKSSRGMLLLGSTGLWSLGKETDGIRASAHQSVESRGMSLQRARLAIQSRRRYPGVGQQGRRIAQSTRAKYLASSNPTPASVSA